MGKVKVYIKNNQAQMKIPVGIRLLIRKCCSATLVYEEFKENAEVSVTFVSNSEIKKLNKQYRNIDKSTDVLSFPLGENGEYDYNNEGNACMLGDIVISIETAIKQAEVYGHSLEREMGFLTVHSMLHLLGYDHIDKLETTKMRGREEYILDKLGMSRNISYISSYER